MGLFGGRRGRAPEYNTPLSPEEEAAFRAWAGDRIADTQDYDLRGAWLANAQQAQNGHLPDTYKKPNHPTFSDESAYSTPDNPGGHWGDAGGGRWTFWASPANLQSQSLPGLAEYFRRVEPGNTMVAPINFDLRRIARAPRKR